MFSARYPTRIISSALGAALLFGVSASAVSAAPAVIVKSSASQYPVGSKVDDKDKITLENGDSITVLTKKGTRTMKGPGTFEVGARPKSNRARFANLTRKRAASRTGTGAVRSAADGVDTPRPLSPNLYYVDVEKPGTVCLYDLAQVRLWRPYNSGIETFQVVDPASEDSIDVTFDDGESVAPLDPARMMVAEGENYMIASPTIESDEAAEPVTITFVNLGQDYTRADELASALAEKGCMVQLELMAEKLAS